MTDDGPPLTEAQRRELRVALDQVINKKETKGKGKYSKKRQGTE